MTCYSGTQQVITDGRGAVGFSYKTIGTPMGKEDSLLYRGTMVVKNWMEPWMAGGLSAAGALDVYFATLTPDSRYTDPNFPKPVLAPSLKERWKEEFTAWPDARFESVSLDAISEHAWVWRWLMHATHTGSNKAVPIPPTGRSYTVPGSNFIELRGDLVSSDLGYFDRFTLLSQLGYTVKPPAPAS